MTVDPKVYALAESFVDDALRPYQFDDNAKAQRQAWIRETAEAIQLEIEHRCKRIRYVLKVESEAPAMRQRYGL